MPDDKPLTKDDLHAVIREAVQEGILAHQCFLSSEEQNIMRDVATGGKIVKRSILSALAGAVLYLIVKGILAAQALLPGK